MHKIIFCFILVFMTVPSYSNNVSIKTVEQYVTQLVNDGRNILNNEQLTKDVKIAKARALILANLDYNWMAQYTLGNYRRTLTTKQIDQFIEIYAQYVSKICVNLVENYKDQVIKVQQVRPLNRGEFMVEMAILNNSGQVAIKVSYLVHQIKDANDQLKVFDVMTEAISLINSQQSEFTYIISHDGFDKLIAKLIWQS